MPSNGVALRRDVGVDVPHERRRPGEYAGTLGPNGVWSPPLPWKPGTIVRAASVQVLARQATPEDVEALLRAAAKAGHRRWQVRRQDRARVPRRRLGTAAIVVGAGSGASSGADGARPSGDDTCRRAARRSHHSGATVPRPQYTHT